MHVCISVVSHSQSELVQALLASLDRHVSCDQHQVTVVITENNLSYCDFNCKYPIEYLVNLRRKGFGSNHNSAFEISSPDVFLIVNPDIVFTQTFDLDAIIDSMQKNRIAITSPVIVDRDGETADYKRADLTPINLIKRKIFRRHEEYFNWYAGMFLVVSGPAFRSIGGFDPLFFMYVEDCDLCMRASKNGFKVGDTTHIAVLHDARRASRKLSKHFYWHCSSLLKYWIKTALGRV